MYSVVLATMLTAGTATPDFFFKAIPPAGCGGCYGGCYGYSCGGCYGGCYGYSCSGCYGCSGYNVAYSCGGCCGGWSCGGCCGGYSCCGGCYGGYSIAFSCGGCCGGSCFGYSGGHIGYSGSCFGSSNCFGGVIGGGCGGCIGGYSSALPLGTSVQFGSASAPVAQPILSSAAAVVTVKAPVDVKIEVNGTSLTRKGEEQSFATPTLSATGKHTYEFVATLTRDGQTVKTTQTIEVRPGSESRVDFSTLVAQLNVKQERARVIVALPPEADLFVDGVKMASTTASRKFQTPLLEVGKAYSYELRATLTREGQMHEATQRVRVEAGKDIPVEFAETAFVKVPARTASAR